MASTQGEFDFFEDIYDALKAAVNAMGGAKVVGHALWPNKPVEDARNRLLNCLDRNRPEKVDAEEIMFILRRAKEEGFYSAQAFWDRECGYQPGKPMNDAEEERTLVAVIDQAAETFERAVARLERLKSGKAVG